MEARSSYLAFVFYNGRMAEFKLKKADIPECAKLKRAGLNDKDIAAYLGVSAKTFSLWTNHPKTENQRNLCNALKKAEAEAKAMALSKIQNAGVNGSWQAFAWWLERKYPKEFGRPEAQLARELAEKAQEATEAKFDEVLVKIREAADGNRADA